MQSADGSWPCNYKQIDGPGATSLALFALSYVPEHARPADFEDRANRALTYLLAHIDKHGRIVQPPQPGQTEGPPAYPTYEGALLLMSARRLSLKAPPDKLRAVVDYLLNVQMHEGNGFKPDDVHYGGWDMTGDPEARAYTIGTNVNVTAFVAEALAMERKARADDQALSKKIDGALARTAKWILRCRSADDGGFWLAANPQDFMNKAQWHDEARMKPRSYGTATADALRVLVACGAKADDPARGGAIRWLTERDAVDKVPGFEKIPPEIGWQDGLRFYYLASLARVLPHFPAEVAAKRRAALLAQLLKQQRDNDGWANDAAQMREDDPVVATSLAIIALGALQESPPPSK